MVAQDDSKLKVRMVANVPGVFRASYKANIQKAADWWLKREQIVAMSKNSISRASGGAVQRVNRKASEGRKRKRAPCVVWLHEEFMDEFLRFRSVRIKVSRSILIDTERHIVRESTGSFGAATIEHDRPIVDRIDLHWVQTFLERHDVVTRKRCGKLAVSDEKQRSIERAVAYHLGVVKRAFEAGKLNEDLVLNMDATHFVVNMDDHKTLEKRGASTVKYHNVVSGGECMTLAVLLRGGPNARVEVPMIVFQNDNRSYPIRGLADDVPSATYRTGPRG